MNFITFLKFLSIPIDSFENKSFNVKYNGFHFFEKEKYIKLTTQLFDKNIPKAKKKKIRLHLIRLEDKFYSKLANKLMLKMNIVSLPDDQVRNVLKSLKTKKDINHFKKKYLNLSKQQSINIKFLIRRTVYGLELYSRHFFKPNINPVERRLKLLELSCSLINSLIENQSLYSLMILDTKFNAFNKNKPVFKISNFNSYKDTVFNVLQYYNGSEHKKAYARRGLRYFYKKLSEISHSF
jgi:hypothetical protein